MAAMLGWIATTRLGKVDSAPPLPEPLANQPSGVSGGPPLSPAQVSDDAVDHGGRRIRLRAFPIGIIPEPFQEAVEPEVVEEVAALLRAIAPSRLVLGVDRLDYTKGIPERLEAFGRLLERNAVWRGQVSLVQISVPSRADVPEYAEQRRRIENTVGRINGEYGEAAWVPVRYLYRSTVTRNWLRCTVRRR